MRSSALAATVLTIVAAGAAAASAPAHAQPAPGPAPPRDPFVRVHGNQLVRDGHPFRFVGANLAIMHGPDNRAAAEDVLAAAVRDGIRVGRIWALGEGDADAAPWLRDNFLFRAGPEGWIDVAVLHLDRVIAAAGRLGLRLIITLSNNWGDYGGVPRYLRWAGVWREGVYGAGDRFYSDPRTRAAYRSHVVRLLERTNHLTGLRYRDDPTILAWELMNESSVATAAGATARRAWIVEMARVIHAAAPNHLVMPGVAGYRFERERVDWLAICRLPEVDICDGHVYPEELIGSRDSSLLDGALDDHVRLAQTIAGKPFVLGEFGVRGDGGGLWRDQARGFWVSRILERLRFDGAAGGLIWIYQPAGGADRAHGISAGPAGADPAADALRAAIGSAAAVLYSDGDGPPRGGFNPGIAVDPTRVPLMPLHAEFEGQAPSVPLVRADLSPGRALTVTWDPAAYARADWEASGIYGGGAIEHAWGGETGWFEYEYEIAPATTMATPRGPVATPRGPVATPRGPVETSRRPVETSRGPMATPRGPVAARAGASSRTLTGTLSVRARVSSEYPGSLSPPDGASAFEVSLDGVQIGRAIAPRDDGKGHWVTMRTPTAAVPQSAMTSGRHRLRFTVKPGPRAHGLAIYGRPGDKPISGTDTGPIELRLPRPWSRQ